MSVDEGPTHENVVPPAHIYQGLACMSLLIGYTWWATPVCVRGIPNQQVYKPISGKLYLLYIKFLLFFHICFGSVNMFSIPVKPILI